MSKRPKKRPKRQTIPKRPTPQPIPPEPGAPVRIAPSKLPRPTIVGFATELAIEERDLHWLITFSDPRWGIVASFVTALDDLETHWQMSEKFARECGEWARRSNVTVPEVSGPHAGSLLYPPQVCNIIRLSRSGLDGQFEAYYATSHSLAMARRRLGEVEVVPVLAVQVPTPLLITFLTYLEGRLPFIEEQVERLRGLAV
jgi:hypothetical protein